MDLITFSSRSIDPRRRSQVRARKKPNLINCERNAREIDNNGSICLREIGEKSVIAQAWKIRFSPASLERFVPNVCSHVVPIFSDGSRLISNQNAFAKWKHERSGPTLCTLNATKGLTINVNELEHLFVTRISGISWFRSECYSEVKRHTRDFCLRSRNMGNAATVAVIIKRV